MTKRKSTSRKHSVYTNLSHRKHKRRTRKDASARKRAEYLASLPKHPVKRFFHRLHPKRVAGYWFSKRGAKMALKLAGIGILLGFLLVGSLFAYYRKDIEKIRPGELASRVQTTVTKYYDRNGILLWEDKGNGDYTLAIEKDEMGDYIRQATVAIEDQNFYNHHGVSFVGLTRAAINNATGGEVQGGSTLTQQLVKQVFLADEASKRGLNGIPRKIKEVILAVEVERSYDKEDIITLYLNESPYGGRRNGVESAARTYFGKPTKKLSLAQASLLAAIPQNPSYYDPYNISGHEALIARQHHVLRNMVELDMITQSEADAAKNVPILDQIKPEGDQYKNIKAPHFVLYVKEQLEKELGVKTVREGGFTVHTTVDYRIQKRLEQAMKNMFNSSTPGWAGFNNGAGTVIDSQTGQIVAMLGSRNFKYPGYGQNNAATSYLQPGSTVKPLVYASLFEKQSDRISFGSGSILRDEKLSGTLASTYGSELNNWDDRFKGDINIRKALGESRNIPAVKAMYLNGVERTLKQMRAAGEINYCTKGTETQVGLASAIGGCGTDQINHTNAIATLARSGLYVPPATVLSVKNSQNDEVKKWEKTKGKRVYSAQSTYIVSDILSDPAARSGTFNPYGAGFAVDGAKTATKTGTSNLGEKAKDLWMVSYSPVLSMSVWLGNADNRPLQAGSSTLTGPIVGDVMAYAHQVYKKDGKYTTNQWFSQPSGIKTIRGELYPSWFDEDDLQKRTKLTFDRVSKKRATSCTPDAARVEIEVYKLKDPVTDENVYFSDGGYDPEEKDDVHKCNDRAPDITNIGVVGNKIRVDVDRGTHRLDKLEVRVNGKAVRTLSASGSGSYEVSYSFENNESYNIQVTVTDKVYYTDSASESHSTGGSGGGGNGNAGGNNRNWNWFDLS